MPILIQLWGAAGEAAFLPYSHVMPALWSWNRTQRSEAEEDSYWPRLAKQGIQGWVASVTPTDRPVRRAWLWAPQAWLTMPLPPGC